LTNLYFLCWRKIRKKLYSSRYWKLLPFQTFKIGYLVSLSTHALFVELALKLLGLEAIYLDTKQSKENEKKNLKNPLDIPPYSLVIFYSFRVIYFGAHSFLHMANTVYYYNPPQTLNTTQVSGNFCQEVGYLSRTQYCVMTFCVVPLSFAMVQEGTTIFLFP
jgi:hypothetical protein